MLLTHLIYRIIRLDSQSSGTDSVSSPHLSRSSRLWKFELLEQVRFMRGNGGNWEVPNFEGDGGNFPDIIKSVFRACWTPSGVENVWVWCRHLPPSHHRPSRREGWHPFPTFITGLGGSCKEAIIIRLNYNPSASGTWPLQSSSSGAILVFIIVVGV